MIIPMNRNALEPDLLLIFRAYIFVRLGAMLLVAIVYFFWVGGAFEPAMYPTAVLFVLETLCLLVYLYVDGFRRRLKWLYLPLALGVASIGPIIEFRYVLNIYNADRWIEFWLIFPFLSIPLILTAWQYGIREIVAFCAGTAAVEITLIILIPHGRPVDFLIDGGTILTRSIFFLFIGYIVLHLVAAQRRQREELAAANRKLVRYASTLEQLAVTRERNRLARELHDTLAHTLSGLAVQLDALATVWQPLPPKAERMLTHALVTTREGLDETRRALQDLRAVPLDDLGLALAIRNLAESVAARAGLDLILDMPDDLGNLSSEVEQTYYRVVQEALTNVIKHASATVLNVSLKYIDGRLALSVSDNGQGIDFGDAEMVSHFGIQGMRERAELIGGTLEIKPNPNGGTCVSLLTCC